MIGMQKSSVFCLMVCCFVFVNVSFFMIDCSKHLRIQKICCEKFVSRILAYPHWFIVLYGKIINIQMQMWWVRTYYSHRSRKQLSLFIYVKVSMIAWHHVVHWIIGSCILFCIRVDAPATALN